MSERRNPSRPRIAAGASSASPTRLPILGGTRAKRRTDDAVPLLFDYMPLVPRSEVRHGSARASLETYEATAGDTRHEVQKDGLPRAGSLMRGDSNAAASSSPAPILLTVRQVEATLQLGRTRTYELLRSGEIPVRRIGRLIRVSRLALEEWAARSEEPQLEV